MKILCNLGFLIGSALSVSNAFGQLVAWEVSEINASSNYPFSATTLDANVTSAILSLGSGVTVSSAGDTFGGSSFNTTLLASAISDADYISFTITPSSFYELSFSSITYLVGLSGSTAFNVALLSNLTGFTATDSLDTYSFSSTSPSAHSITLSGVGLLQNVNGSVEFRLYGWRDTSGTSTFRIRTNSGNDLIVNGTTALAPVPEPATYAAILGGLTLVGVTIIRRRKRVVAA